MKKLFASVCIGSALFFSGCSDNKIKEVKNGVLDFDKTLTIGQAFDNYKYCKNVNWKSAKTDNGRDFVQVTCDYDIYNKDISEDDRKHLKEKGAKKAEIKYQFYILKSSEKKFKFKGAYITLYGKDGKVLFKSTAPSKRKAFKELKIIYNNKPLD